MHVCTCVLMYACVQVYLCVHVQGDGCTHMCMWRPEASVRSLLYHSPPYFLRQSFSLNPVSNLLKMGWPGSSGGPLISICRTIGMIQSQTLMPRGKHLTSCATPAAPGNILNSSLSYPTEPRGNLVETTSKHVKLSASSFMLTRLHSPPLPPPRGHVSFFLLLQEPTGLSGRSL